MFVSKGRVFLRWEPEWSITKYLVHTSLIFTFNFTSTSGHNVLILQTRTILKALWQHAWVILGLYYKHMMIVNDDSSIISKWSCKLIDNARVVIYDSHMFIIQATGLVLLNFFMKHILSGPNAIKQNAE